MGAESPKDECGLFGVWAPGEDVARLTYFGLFAQQHRGQESAGIAVSDGHNILIYKDLGLVAQVFNEATLATLQGDLAVGHTRYSTTGSTTWDNAQPVFKNDGVRALALGHNGNLVNTGELVARLGRSSAATTDSDLVATMLASEMAHHDLEGAAMRVLPELEGAFCFVMADERSVFAARDPHGLRPLAIGKLPKGFVVASETCALDIVGGMIVREDEPDDGQVAIDRGVTVGYFSQDVGEMSGRTVLEETMAGAGKVWEAAHEVHELEHAMADPARADELDQLLDRFGRAQAIFDDLGGYALEARAREILSGLGFRDEVIEDDVGKLSGGWKMRVALARILLLRPDALLLDEPTNHLDIESIIWLEQFLRGFEGALVLTSHDREFMNRIVTKIVEIDGGELTTYSGNYDFYEAQRAVATAQAEAQYARQQAMLAKEEAFIARFKARASHAAQVQSRVKKLEKIEKVEPPKRRKVIEFEFRPAPRSGDDVAKLRQVSKGYGTRKVHDQLDLLLRRKERWCVMGVNGAGKSTLLKLIAGESRPDEGTVTIGASVKLGYFAQHSMELLDPRSTVIETLQRAFPLATLGSLRTLSGAFGFPGDSIEKSCRILSGGEKARLVLALMLYDPPNFLVLDEPTNHLDLDTKEMLIKSLGDFEGTMIFVSHDRRFLGALSNRVLELTPEGARTYDGGYVEYVVQSGHEAPGI